MGDHRRLRRRAAGWLLGWLVLFGFWMLLVDTWEWPELAAGAGSAAIGLAATSWVARHERLAPGVPSLAVLRAVGWALARVPWEGGRVLTVVAGQLVGRRSRPGQFRTVSLAHDRDLDLAARILTRSLAPNEFVVDTDPAQAHAVVHRLVRPSRPRRQG